MALGRDASAIYRGDEMMVGEEKKLLEDQIWTRNVTDDGSILFGSQAVMSCGDGLFIPKGWWHSVKGVGGGITGSVSQILRRSEYSPSMLMLVGQLVVPVMVFLPSYYPCSILRYVFTTGLLNMCACRIRAPRRAGGQRGKGAP